MPKKRSLFKELFYFLRAYKAVSIIIIFILLGFGLGRFQQPEIGRWIYIGTIVAFGIPKVFEIIKGLFKKDLGVDIIALLAIIGSLPLGEYLAGALIVLMLNLSDSLEEYALSRASEAFAELDKKSPKIVHLLNGDHIEDVAIEKIKIGDLLLVKPGELIPVDGEIIEGTSALDLAALTGEALPVKIAPGSEVLSGSINLDVPLKLKTIRPASKSQYAQIVKLLHQAQGKKARIHRLADRYGAYFIPLTLLVALFAFLISGSFVRVLAVLVIATPCPLIIATPVAVLSGINKLARRGIIVKSGQGLEQLGECKVLIIDKTGTITVGKPKVIEIQASNDFSKEELLRLIASVEVFSNHPLAKSIVTEAESKKLPLSKVKKVKEEPGRGLTAVIGNQQIIVGSASYVGVKSKEREGHTLQAYVAINGKYAGYIKFADEIRGEAKEFIRNVRRQGIKTIYLLSGDKKETAEKVGQQLKLDRVIAEALPTEKVEVVKELSKDNKVVMIGDGFNDAPALASATVGVAMGSGSNISNEAADLVLLRNDLSDFGYAFQVSKRVVRVAGEGMTGGIGASVLGMILASLGFLIPVMGAILQEIIDMITILNALRVNIDKK